MNEAQHTQFERDRDTWLANLDGVVLLPDDGSGAAKSGLPMFFEYVKQEVDRKGGYSSISAFQLCLRELLEHDPPELVLLKAGEDPQIPEDILAFIRDVEAGNISTYELRKRYTGDRRFHDFYDVYVDIAQSSAQQPVTLTLKEYNSLPIEVIRRRMVAEPAFAAAVHKLLGTGQVGS